MTMKLSMLYIYWVWASELVWNETINILNKTMPKLPSVRCHYGFLLHALHSIYAMTHAYTFQKVSDLVHYAYCKSDDVLTSATCYYYCWQFVFFCSCFFCVYVSYRMHFITYSAINKFCVIFARIYRAHKFQFGWYLSVFMHVYLPTRNKWLWQNKQTTINTLNEIYAIKYIVLSIQQNIVKILNKTNIIELCIQCCWLTNL